MTFRLVELRSTVSPAVHANLDNSKAPWYSFNYFLHWISITAAFCPTLFSKSFTHAQLEKTSHNFQPCRDLNVAVFQRATGLGGAVFWATRTSLPSASWWAEDNNQRLETNYSRIKALFWMVHTTLSMKCWGPVDIILPPSEARGQWLLLGKWPRIKVALNL